MVHVKDGNPWNQANVSVQDRWHSIRGAWSVGWNHTLVTLIRALLHCVSPPEIFILNTFADIILYAIIIVATING